MVQDKIAGLIERLNQIDRINSERFNTPVKEQGQDWDEQWNVLIDEKHDLVDQMVDSSSAWSTREVDELLARIESVLLRNDIYELLYMFRLKLRMYQEAQHYAERIHDSSDLFCIYMCEHRPVHHLRFITIARLSGRPDQRSFAFAKVRSAKSPVVRFIGENYAGFLLTHKRERAQHIQPSVDAFRACKDGGLIPDLKRELGILSRSSRPPIVQRQATIAAMLLKEIVATEREHSTPTQH